MKKFKFRKLDAFAKGKSSGNPAGYIYVREDQISPGEMQLIARQLKGFVNEVAYVIETEENKQRIFNLKYYSSECEVEFCGHGTIACMYDFIGNDAELVSRKEISIITKMGTLTVFNDIKNSDSIFISAPDPHYFDVQISETGIAENMKIPATEIEGKFPVSKINAGLNTLIVPITTLDSCLAMYPDCRILKQFCLDNQIDIILVFTTETSDRQLKYRTRVFAPKYGYLEDPATGSGNSAFGYYLLKNKMWDGARISIEQGPDLHDPNIVRIGTVTNLNKTNVIFGGSAVLRIEGYYYLQ